MKKLIAITLCALLALSLAACGGADKKEPAPTEAPAVSTPAPTEVPAVTEVPAAPSEAPAAPADDVAETVAKILSMKDQPVQDLYDLVGQPNDSDYSSSCLVSGGKDGQLFYDGFTVYTLVQPDGTETIYDCE